MNHADYLIVGASHAGLEAANAIRTMDPDGSIVLMSREVHPPYSPTVLPYVLSGHTDPGRTALREQRWFADSRIEFLTDSTLAAVDARGGRAILADGAEWRYGKLLLATGASPAIPQVPGLDGVRHHVLRSLDDALALRAAATTARHAVVLGAGLVGMHAAENLAQAGLSVTVIEARDRVLPAYFDAIAGGMIAAAFAKAGVTLLMGRRVEAAAAEGDGCRLTLSDGAVVGADLLVVATGVKPAMAYLGGADIAADQGILVDERMRTSAAGIWAAGDVAQARDFYGPTKRVNGILPCAVEQGRIAGRDMAGDADVKPFPGGVPINTYRFFGHRAVAVGDPAAADETGATVTVRQDAAGRRYLKLVVNDGRLRSIACVDQPIDAGIMWQLILRRVDLSPVMDDFLSDPVKTGRVLMSRLWR